MPNTTQFGRSVKLLLLNNTKALDLSGLRITFRVNADDASSPNEATIRVYNLADKTAQHAVAEYSSVSLQAGYGDQTAVIFTGTVIYYKTGKENNTDSFLEIFAADGDEAYNQAVANTTWAAGYTFSDLLKFYAKNMGLQLDQNALTYLAQAGGAYPAPRGKVDQGLFKLLTRDLSRAVNARWSIQNGVLTLIPNDSYLPGTIIEINSATGMVGTPEATQEGIELDCLLNPLLKIGYAIRINNQDITQTTFKNLYYPGIPTQYVAGVDPDPDPQNNGLYRLIVIEHSGDTRGQEFYSHLICLKIDPAKSPAVAPYGIRPSGDAPDSSLTVGG
jgi:hypothetical protein